MPARKTKSVKKKEAPVEEVIAEVPADSAPAIVTPPPADPQTPPVSSLTPAPAQTAVVPQPVVNQPVPTAPSPATSPQVSTEVKPDLVKTAAAQPLQEETPNLDGWVAINEILPQGQNLKNTVKAGSFFLAGLLFGLAVGAGGMWWWSNKMQPAVSSQTAGLVKDIKKATGKTASTLSTPSVTPAASNLPAGQAGAVTREKIMLMVQNGSGVKGAAATAADLLSKLGYQIIGTGNAKGGPYTESQLTVKKSKTDVSKLLQDDLKADYQLAKTVEELNETATYDAIFIVGKK